MSSTSAFALSAFAGLALLGCAAQAPADQVSSRPTVRMCSGNSCVDQDRRAVTFADAPSDPEAERRLAALTEQAQRDPRAAYDLALRLLRGDGVERDGHRAIEWLRRAGDQGLVPAQSALGRMYLAGLEEMGSDPSEAHAWLSLAAAGGDGEARRLLPEAQAARQNEQARYVVREHVRKSWAAWYSAAPYHWYWGGSGWALR